MREVFISHSSVDKAMYADYLAAKLGPHCHYDSFSFETGEKTKDEIERCIHESCLHVVLLSETSLKSDWVQYELKLIYDKLGQSQFDAFFPIIIDHKVAYNDSRIPEWIKSSYNLKPIYKPSIAYLKIRNKLSSLKFQQHSSYSKPFIFSGRNDEMQKIEERFNDLEKEIPKCLIVSGLQGSGRKTLIREALIKNNVVNRFNSPLVLTLDRQMSIENLIQQCLAYVPDTIVTSCAKQFLMQEKIKNLTKIFEFFQSQNLFLLIEDAGCIVDSSGEIAYWFINALSNLTSNYFIGIAAQTQVNRFKYKKNDEIFAITISTFSKVERNALLKACSEIKKLNLNREDLLFVSGLLTGFPDQIFFAVELIEEQGFNFVKKNSYQIKEYGEDRVQEVIRYVSKDEKKLNLLILLASFDFISASLIEEITKNYCSKELLAQLLNLNLVEKFGVYGEYFKVNDAVKDFISRSRMTSEIDILPYLKEQMDAIKNNKDFLYELDIDTFNLVITGNIEAGEDVSDVAIPSHYLKTIMDLYNSSKYNEIISIVDKLKETNAIINFDTRISAQIYDYFCLSLARERNSRVWDEVANIRDEADYYFIKAFAYKKIGNNQKAYEMAIKALSFRQMERAKRLLVDILLLSNAYDEAYVYAKENYENKPSNPYHIQAYFNCIIRRDKSDKALLNRLLDEIACIQSRIAQDMYCEIKARYLFEIEGKCAEAIRMIQRRLSETKQGRRYLLMTLFDVYLQEKNITGMDALLKDHDFVAMKNLKDTKNNYYYRLALYNYLTHEPWLSVERQVDQMQFVSEDLRNKTLERIRNYK